LTVRLSGTIVAYVVGQQAQVRHGPDMYVPIARLARDVQSLS
jgi:hypothetical protein